MQRNCPFPAPEQEVENNGVMADGLRKAYIKGRMDTLCSLTAYKIIPIETAAYLAGIDQKMFETELWHWQHDWEYMESEED